jgi:hypothetical protein
MLSVACGEACFVRTLWVVSNLLLNTKKLMELLFWG